MRPRTVAVATVAALGLALLINSVYGQRSPRRARKTPAPAAGPQMKHAFAPELRAVAAADQTPPVPWVSVDWSLTLNASDQALYQRMATLLSGVTAVPNDRLNYYSAVINDIGSWGGLVSIVQSDNNGGYVVTVPVSGCVLSGHLGGSSMTLFTDYSELYHIDANNNVTYAGFLDPNGWAGSMPGMSVD